MVSRLPLLRSAPDDKARKGKARVLALLSAVLNLVAQHGSVLRVPPVSFLKRFHQPLAAYVLCSSKPMHRSAEIHPTCLRVIIRHVQGGLEELARKVHVGRREVLEPLLDLFYHKR